MAATAQAQFDELERSQAIVKLGRRYDDPLWTGVMSDAQITAYLRTVEGRLAKVEAITQNAEVSRAEIRVAIAELRTSLSQHIERSEKWQRYIEVSAASRSWIDKLVWVALTAAITSVAWWLLPLP